MNGHIESVHEGKESFKCNVCDTAFSEKNKLNGHIESVHEGKKPFKCNDCGTAFSKMHCGYSVSILNYILAKITLTTKFTLAKNL
jgi:predicted nucleic acid binding AN1-type Zn finger protein